MGTSLFFYFTVKESNRELVQVTNYSPIEDIGVDLVGFRLYLENNDGRNKQKSYPTRYAVSAITAIMVFVSYSFVFDQYLIEMLSLQYTVAGGSFWPLGC